MEKKPQLKTSDSLIIGFDIGSKDEVALTVTRPVGKKYCVIKAVTGDEARDLYDKLTNNESKVERGLRRKIK
jgi:hypothetical protein